MMALLLVVVLLILGISGGSWLYLRYRFGQIGSVNVSAEAAVVAGQPVNFLVLGSDSRSGLTGPMAAQAGSTADVQGQRSDVIMVWHVDPKRQTISILSIPRDTLITTGPLASQLGRFNRINTAYSGGPNGLVEVIEANFGIPINHVAQVNFSGFVGATDALGGVWMNFPYPARDAYSGLAITQSGCQLLNGTQALGVARSRHYEYYANGYWHGDGSSDFGRIERQGTFLRSMINAAKSKYNPLTLNAFLGSIPQGVVIDKRLGLNELIGLAVRFHSLDPNAIQTQTLPTTNVGYVAPWGDVLFAGQPSAQEMLTSIFGDQLMRPTSPAPNSSLQTPMPPMITPTTQAALAPKGTSPSGSGDVSGSTESRTPPTTAPAPPSFDPTPCAPA